MISVRNIFRRKVRSFLTLIGIAIGIAAIVALGAMADGLRRGYAAIFGGSGADLLISQAESVDISFSLIEEGVGNRLASMPEVKEIEGMIFNFSSTEGVPIFPVFGLDPKGFAISHFKVIEGEGLGTTSKRKPIILGRAAAEGLEKEIGDTFKLSGITFRVVGIFETGVAFEEGGGVITLKDAQVLINKPRKVNAYQIKLKDLGRIEHLRKRVERLFPDLTVSTSSEFVENQEWVSYLKGFAWAISIMAVIIGAFGMMNTLLMSVFERTREIGTLRAFGWRRLRVLRMVLGESLTLSIIGGIMGIFLGMAALRGLGRIPAVASILPGSLSLDLLLRAIFTALSLGAIGGAYPAWWASNLLPLEAIRYEGGARGASYVIGGMAFRNLLRRRTRSLLTMVGVGISIMAVVAFGALSDGIIAQFVAISTRSGAELTLREAGTSMDYSTIDERVGKKIAQIPGVKHVGGMIYGYAKGREVPWFIVFGYHPKSRGINYFKIVEGEAISANRQMIIGRVAAEILDKRVGDTMKLFDTTFRIVGIYETGIAFEDGGGVISLRDAQILFKKPRQVTFYGVHLEDPDIAEEVRRRIEDDFPELAVSFSSDFVEETEDIKTIRAITGAIFFLAILVGGVGMTNTMVMSVFERTREIGVLRALGWRRARVLWMILKESLLLSAISGVFGIIMGVILCKILSGFPVAAMMVRVDFTPSLLARSFSMALLLGAIGGLYPAWRATRLSPVEALRYE